MYLRLIFVTKKTNTNDSKLFLILLFLGNLRDQKEKGLYKSRRWPPLTQDHIEQIYENYFLPHFDNDPCCLQHKVYFEIAYFLGKCGKEGLRDLKKNSFSIKKTAQGREYLKLNYNEATKKSQGDDINEMNEQAIILSQDGNKRCLINSYKLYVSKLTEIDGFFQQPNNFYRKPSDAWYNRNPVGKNTIAKFMSLISTNAGLSITYTNHCIRGTTATAMYKSGYSLHDIASVTKHKNLESLKYYLAQLTIDDMENYSNSLFNYTNKNDPKQKSDSQNTDKVLDSDDDFEPNPPRQCKKLKTTATSMTTYDNNTQAVVPFNSTPPDNQDILTQTNNNTKNIMAMYKQNPVGMLMGATLNNCTININLPK